MVPSPACHAWYATEAYRERRDSAEDLRTFLAANIGAPGSPLERAMRIAQEVRVLDGTEGAGWGFSWRT